MDVSSGKTPASEAEKLGLRLKEVREYLNLSQQYVSERTGIPRSAISDIERGLRKVDSLELKKMAGLYRRPVGYFLEEDPVGAGGDHAIAALARMLNGLTEEDRHAVKQFAEFLRQDKARTSESG